MYIYKNPDSSGSKLLLQRLNYPIRSIQAIRRPFMNALGHLPVRSIGQVLQNLPPKVE